MNTGNQRSGVTPFKAWTTTTPTGPCSAGEKNKYRKSLFEIMAAHRLPFVATASTSFPKDFMEKVEKAKALKGCKVIHISAPCPTGWGFDPAKTIEIGRLAVECGLWYLAEYKDGEFKVNYEVKKFKPVDEYFKAQGRFKHLTEEDFKEIEGYRDIEWDRLMKRFS
jgi:pyruvate ferredoxin oxidoreductase beta subunit